MASENDANGDLGKEKEEAPGKTDAGNLFFAGEFNENW